MGLGLAWLAVAALLTLAGDTHVLGTDVSRLGAVLLVVGIPVVLGALLVQTSREAEARRLRQRGRL